MGVWLGFLLLGSSMIRLRMHIFTTDLRPRTRHLTLLKKESQVDPSIEFVEHLASKPLRLLHGPAAQTMTGSDYAKSTSCKGCDQDTCVVQAYEEAMVSACLHTADVTLYLELTVSAGTRPFQKYITHDGRHLAPIRILSHALQAGITIVTIGCPMHDRRMLPEPRPLTCRVVALYPEP